MPFCARVGSLLTRLCLLHSEQHRVPLLHVPEHQVEVLVERHQIACVHVEGRGAIGQAARQEGSLEDAHACCSLRVPAAEHMEYLQPSRGWGVGSPLRQR